VSAVPNFHLRGLRPELHDALRARAESNGRSVNAEIVSILEEAVATAQDRQALLRDLRRFRRRVRVDADAEAIEHLLRQARDERDRRP
jgi:hypothetical protein